MNKVMNTKHTIHFIKKNQSKTPWTWNIISFLALNETALRTAQEQLLQLREEVAELRHHSVEAEAVEAVIPSATEQPKRNEAGEGVDVADRNSTTPPFSKIVIDSHMNHQAPIPSPRQIFGSSLFKGIQPNNRIWGLQILGDLFG